MAAAEAGADAPAPTAEFERIYARRSGAIAHAANAGEPVLAYLGADMPAELAIAAGLTPIRLMGEPALDRPDGDRLLGPRVTEAARSQLQRVLDGACDGARGLVIARSTEELVWLFYALRALRRTDPDLDRRLPPLHLFDLLHLPHRTSGTYSLTRGRQLLTTLGAWSGREADEPALRAAVALCNETRRLLQQVQALRAADEPRLSGVHALQVMGAGALMPRARYNALLEALLSRGAELAPRPGRRVFVTGGSQDTPDIYAAIEAAGAVVVGEDHDWSDGGCEGLVDEAADDPVEAIVERYRFAPPPGAKHSIAERAAHTATRAAELRAELVVCVIRNGERGPRWDAPDQRQALAERGIEFLLLDDQDYRIDPAVITARVAEALAATGRRLAS